MAGRKQFTSCEPCRNARIGCDAALTGGASCSNCVRRGKCCTSRWGDRASRKKTKHSQSLTSPGGPKSPHWTSITSSAELASNRSTDLGPYETPPSSSPSFQRSESVSSEMEQTACRRQQALTLHRILWEIFVDIQESRSAIWLGSNCCPYIEVTAEPETSLSNLMVTLDGGCRIENGLSSWIGGGMGENDRGSVSSEEEEEDYLIDHALVSAVHAFAVRWLSFRDTVMSSDGNSVENTLTPDEHIRNTLWHQASKAVYSIMTRPSYRSVLALHLVAITASSIDHKDHGIEDLCGEVALSHHLRLKSTSQHPSPDVISSEFISPWQPINLFQEQDNPTDEAVERASKQDIAYWLGIVCDTSRSLTQCRSSILLPGQSGDTKVWNHLRQRTATFDQSFRSLHGSQEPMSDETVASILQHATACKSMCWWTMTRVQDALFHRMTDELVETALESAVQEIRRFHDLFAPLLDMCARDFMIMNQKNQVNYLLLVVHFYWGTLMLVDALAKHSTFLDLIAEPCLSRVNATRAIVNALNLALQLEIYSANPATSLLLLDPQPETMTSALASAASSLALLYDTRALPSRAVEAMLSVIITGLCTVSQVSMTARTALPTVRSMCLERGLTIHTLDGGSKATKRLPAYTDPSVLATMWNPDFTKEVVQDYRFRRSLDRIFGSKNLLTHDLVNPAPTFFEEPFWAET